MHEHFETRASHAESTEKVVDDVFALPLQAQLGVLRTIAPHILARLAPEQRSGFLRAVNAEIVRAERGQPTYDVRPQRSAVEHAHQPVRHEPMRRFEEPRAEQYGAVPRNEPRSRGQLDEATRWERPDDPSSYHVPVSTWSTTWGGASPPVSNRGLAEPSRPPEARARRYPRGYTRSDERIREDVCDRLADLAEIDSSNVEVAVSGGEVTLSGSVPERWMKHAVEQVSAAVSGVKDVHNRLRVPQPEPHPQRPVQ